MMVGTLSWLGAFKIGSGQVIILVGVGLAFIYDKLLDTLLGFSDAMRELCRL